MRSTCVNISHKIPETCFFPRIARCPNLFNLPLSTEIYEWRIFHCHVWLLKGNTWQLQDPRRAGFLPSHISPFHSWPAQRACSCLRTASTNWKHRSSSFKMWLIKVSRCLLFLKRTPQFTIFWVGFTVIIWVVYDIALLTLSTFTMPLGNCNSKDITVNRWMSKFLAEKNWQPLYIPQCWTPPNALPKWTASPTKRSDPILDRGF